MNRGASTTLAKAGEAEYPRSTSRMRQGISAGDVHKYYVRVGEAVAVWMREMRHAEPSEKATRNMPDVSGNTSKGERKVSQRRAESTS